MGVFGTVVADPPWRFGNCGNRASPSYVEAYQTMSLEDIIQLGGALQKLVQPDAHLWLWAPNAFTISGEAARVSTAFGFTAKTLLTWVKTTKSGAPAMGMGNYLRAATEQCVFASRGRCPPLVRNRLNVLMAQRTRHSAKPDEFYELVEAVSPGPYLELFGRRRRSDWTVLGDEGDIEYRGDILPALQRLAAQMVPDND